MGKPVTARASTRATSASRRGSAAGAKTSRSATAKRAAKSSSTRAAAKPAPRGHATPDAYYAALPDERRPVMQALRRAIAKALPKGFEETMGYGMPGWVVPLKTYPAGYHCAPGTPLPFLGMASQKGHISFYHMGLYMDPALFSWFKAECAKRLPRKLDMGKSCVRFKRAEDVPIELLADLCRRVTPAQWIAIYESKLSSRGGKR